MSAAEATGPATAVRRERIGTRLGGLFGAGAEWVRPQPTSLLPDVRFALAAWAAGALALELMRTMGVLGGAASAPVWAQHLAVATGLLPLAGRRRWPLTVATLAGLHMFVVGVTQPTVMASVPLQVAYFLALFSGVAWARDRQQMTLVVGLIVALMFLWLAVVVAVQSGLEDLLPPTEQRGPSLGPVTPAAAAGIYIFLVNAMYFGGAIALGQRAWVAARHTDELVRQRAQLAEQSQSLQEQAVVEERLRIARELHDVVAHHVSVMGVQAAGARSVLRHDPDRAEEALRTVEDSSREAVTQLRGLLGTLRRGAAAQKPVSGTVQATAFPPGTQSLREADRLPGQRAPQPGLAQLGELVARAGDSGLRIDYELVAHEADLDAVPAPIGLAVFRIVQESLTNVRKHSNAHLASVVLRVGPGHVEAEILDNGRPKGGTSGSGLGHLGIRERITSLGGTAEIGPRVIGGYRVRVRFPLREGGRG